MSERCIGLTRLVCFLLDFLLKCSTEQTNKSPLVKKGHEKTRQTGRKTRQREKFTTCFIDVREQQAENKRKRKMFSV